MTSQPTPAESLPTEAFVAAFGTPTRHVVRPADDTAEDGRRRAYCGRPVDRAVPTATRLVCGRCARILESLPGGGGRALTAAVRASTAWTQARQAPEAEDRPAVAGDSQDTHPGLAELSEKLSQLVLGPSPLVPTEDLPVNPQAAEALAWELTEAQRNVLAWTVGTAQLSVRPQNVSRVQARLEAMGLLETTPDGSGPTDLGHAVLAALGSLPAAQQAPEVIPGQMDALEALEADQAAPQTFAEAAGLDPQALLTQAHPEATGWGSDVLRLPALDRAVQQAQSDDLAAQLVVKLSDLVIQAASRATVGPQAAGYASGLADAFRAVQAVLAGRD